MHPFDLIPIYFKVRVRYTTYLFGVSIDLMHFKLFYDLFFYVPVFLQKHIMLKMNKEKPPKNNLFFKWHSFTKNGSGHKLIVV